MSDGNNKRFMRDPVAFLGTDAIMDSGIMIGGGSRRADFDLKKRHGIYFLENYHTSPHGIRAVPIHAYYLPVQTNLATSMLLGADAKYMFTSSLSGCLFAAYGNSASDVTVEHFNAYSDANPYNLILARINQIFNDRHLYCKILSPVSVPGIPVIVYPRFACVIGVSDAARNWEFHCKFDEENTTHNL